MSLEKMEKDIKRMVNALSEAKKKVSAASSSDDLTIDEGPTSQLPSAMLDPKPSQCVPPIPAEIPVEMRRNQAPTLPPGFQGDFQQLQAILHEQRMRSNPQLLQAAAGIPLNIQQVPPVPSMSAAYNQLYVRDPNFNPYGGGVMDPSGHIPFFKVPGGCFMVVHATNQTTPLLHATFVTGSMNGLQFEQTQLPVYSSHQIVAIHMGPYRLEREEINGIFAFANSTRTQGRCNPPRYTTRKR